MKKSTHSLEFPTQNLAIKMVTKKIRSRSTMEDQKERPMLWTVPSVFFPALPNSLECEKNVKRIHGHGKNDVKTLTFIEHLESKPFTKNEGWFQMYWSLINENQENNKSEYRFDRCGWILHEDGGQLASRVCVCSMVRNSLMNGDNCWCLCWVLIKA